MPAPQEKALTKARRLIRELEQKVGQQQLDLVFREALRHFEEDQRRSSAPGETGSSKSSKDDDRKSQGEFNIDRMCWLAGVSRAGYYRHRLDSAPRRAQTGLRDFIQKLALGNHYGYRRVGARCSGRVASQSQMRSTNHA
ncbi:hypothetical protein [Mesorhizobium sp.]|uniref:hypothetical protein n=1 Tax=Mesorhizobium sp. TaxID=1871066 RepID=UPI000FE65A7D|nr:hypothetical protein [Mesorhizobium sp.]RWQ26417.1 MAG: hypothetical protein EOS19_25515 [Mesorhizobium sp.]